MSQWHVRRTTRKDQIFVLMLVILLPLTGCFDAAVGEAEAEDDVTVSPLNDESNGMFSVSGMVDENTPTGCESEGYDHCYLMYEFNTNSGEFVELISLYVGGAYEGFGIDTDCGNGYEGYTHSSSFNYNTNFLPFSDMDCEHTVRIGLSYYNGEPRTPEPYFSLVYQIHEVDFGGILS